MQRFAQILHERIGALITALHARIVVARQCEHIDDTPRRYARVEIGNIGDFGPRAARDFVAGDGCLL